MGVRFGPGAKCNGVLIHVDEEELMQFDVREGGYARRRIDLADIHCHVDSEELIAENIPLWPTNTVEAGSEDGAQSAIREELAMGKVQCPECRVVFEKAREKRRKSTMSCGEDEDDSSIEDEGISVWVYVQSENMPAERSYPITQSYVDIIMRGCLSISHDFARRFLETTHGWWHDGPGPSNEREINTQVMDDKKGEACIDDEKHNSKHHTWVNDRHDPMYVRADSDYSLENGRKIDELIKEHHPRAFQRRVMSM
jgi:hypothetical protein